MNWRAWVIHFLTYIHIHIYVYIYIYINIHIYICTYTYISLIWSSNERVIWMGWVMWMGRYERYERTYTAIHCSTLQHTATHCNTLQLTATPTHLIHSRTGRYEWCEWVAVRFAERHTQPTTATHCNTLQHTCGRHE